MPTKCLRNCSDVLFRLSTAAAIALHRRIDHRMRHSRDVIKYIRMNELSMYKAQEPEIVYSGIKGNAQVQKRCTNSNGPPTRDR